MRSRKLKWSLGAGALLLSQAVLAIGLGEIRLHSAMEERLQAEIDLLNIGDFDEHQMAVSLASPEDFEQAGVERDFQLADLKFRVDLADKARPVIRVSSRQAISEPYLNFLVELRWSSGRLLREYTVLLDLPTFAGDPSPGKQAAATRTVAADSRGPAPASTATQAPVQRPARPAAAAPGGGTGSGADRVQVRGGDTLWGIAERHRPAGATIHQTMLAIAAANPDALIRGDLNLIRSGAWLKLPDAASVRAVDRAAALARLRPDSAAPPVVEAGATEAATPDTAGESSDGELRLAAADTGGAGSGSGTEAGTGVTGAGHDLAAVLEERDRLARENAELQSRIDSLQTQVGTLNRLVELDAPTLANVPQGAVPQEAVPQEAGAASGDAPVLPDAAVGAAGDPAAPLESAPPTDPAAVPAQPAPEPQPQTPEVTAAHGPLAALSELSDRLLPWLGAGAALLLGLLMWVVMRRRSDIQQQGLRLPGDMDRPAAAAGIAVLDDEELSDRDLFAAPSVTEGPDDILAEADVCLSFGHDEQAEELLREALQEYPDEPRVHLKLLEVFASRSDRAAFEAHLPQLAALGDLDTFAAAEALQRQLEDPAGAAPRESFATAPVAAADLPLEDFELGLELDLDAAQPPAAVRPAAPGDTAFATDDLEDFDLDLGPVADATVPDGALAAETSEQPLLEDLDLFVPGQEVATQLELAHAYVDMGDAEGAREILDYVVEAGDDAQRDAARELLARIG